MSQSLIRAAFESRLKTWADAQTPIIPTAFENVSFTPPANRYLRAYLLPADTQSETYDGLHRAYTGVFQVNIIMPLNAGTGAAQVIADAIGALYPVTFTHSTIRVVITRPMGNRPAFVDGDRFILPIYLAYRVDTI